MRLRYPLFPLIAALVLLVPTVLAVGLFAGDARTTARTPTRPSPAWVVSTAPTLPPAPPETVTTTTTTEPAPPPTTAAPAPPTTVAAEQPTVAVQTPRPAGWPRWCTVAHSFEEGPCVPPSAPCAIPAYICAREARSINVWNSQGSGASGKYQAMPGTWGGYGGYEHAAWAPESVQDAWAVELWNGGRGCSHWAAC